MGDFLPILWYFLLVLSITPFIILDGADLGIGLLSINVNESRRSAMLAAIGPVWYANETWLVVAGATLFGAFPVAYGFILSSLYVPVMMLLFGLIFRAVSMEFRRHSERPRFWDIFLGIGCLLAVLGQGFIFGGLFSNLRIEEGLFIGGAWDWLNPVSMLMAVGVMAACSMLGAAQLVRKMGKTAQVQNRRLLTGSASVALALFVAVTAVVLTGHAPVSPLWTKPPQVYLVPLFLVVTLIGLAMVLVTSAAGKNDRAPYIWSVVVFLSTTVATISGIFPYFVPFSLPIVDAASPQSSLIFMLFGAGIILPLIVVYNIYIHRVFDRKVPAKNAEEQY